MYTCVSTVSRSRPSLWIVQQGLHPHPGPVWQGCGFDDSQESDWDESNNGDADGRNSNGWPQDDDHGSCRSDNEEEVEEQFFARGQGDGPVVGGEAGEDSMTVGRPSMLVNPMHSVWEDPEASGEEEVRPRWLTMIRRATSYSKIKERRLTASNSLRTSMILALRSFSITGLARKKADAEAKEKEY